jgi:putative methyltransferase
MAVKEPIQTLLGTVDILKLEKKTFPVKVPNGAPSSPNLVLVLLHDLLFSAKKAIQASDKWPPKPAVVKHQTRLRSELVRLQIKAGKSSIQELGKAGGEVGLNIPRYIRWNPNSGYSHEDLIKHLRNKHGFNFVDEPVYPVPDKTFFRDPHLPAELLVFPRETKWWENDVWYKEGRVILQDKSSCFPAAVLMDGWQADEGQCIDAT